MKGLSRMRGNSHVRFLGGPWAGNSPGPTRCDVGTLWHDADGQRCLLQLKPDPLGRARITPLFAGAPLSIRSAPVLPPREAVSWLEPAVYAGVTLQRT